MDYLERAAWVRENLELLTQIVAVLGGYRILQYRIQHAEGDG